jgi:hypothetical protein
VGFCVRPADFVRINLAGNANTLYGQIPAIRDGKHLQYTPQAPSDDPVLGILPYLLSHPSWEGERGVGVMQPYTTWHGHRTLRDPAAMHRTRLSGKFGAALDPCAAIQVPFELADGQEREIVFRLGTAALGKSVISLVRATPSGVLRPGCTSLRRHHDFAKTCVVVLRIKTLFWQARLFTPTHNSTCTTASFTRGFDGVFTVKTAFCCRQLLFSVAKHHAILFVTKGPTLTDELECVLALFGQIL